MAREISEHDATLAVDAAARSIYEQQPVAQIQPWEDVDVMLKLEIRSSVLPIVWAALGALPDQRRAAWAQGYDKAWHNWTGTHDTGDHANPYPAEEA